MVFDGIFYQMGAFFRETADTVTFGGEEITVCVEVGALAKIKALLFQCLSCGRVVEAKVDQLTLA